MQVIEFISNTFRLANYMLDIVFLWGGIILFFAYPVYFFAKNQKKYAEEQKNGELLSQTIILFLFCMLIGVVWASPEIVSLIVIWRQG